MTFLVPSAGSDSRMAKAQLMTWSPFFLVFLMSLIAESENTRDFLKIGVYIATIGSWTFNWGAYGSLCFNELITNSGTYYGKVIWYGIVNILSMILTYMAGPLVIIWADRTEIRNDLCVGADCEEEYENENMNYEEDIPEFEELASNF